VVLKAMAKDAEDRYATAQELADDLDRYLQDKPIRARRPTLMQRGSKWARRHKPALAVAALLLMMAVVGLATSTLLVWQQKEQTREALRQVTWQGIAAKHHATRAE